MDQEKLRSLPPRPGVYLFLNRQKRVIYVGKAKNIRSRVGSYFQSRADLGPRKDRMVGEVADLDYIATDSELEAFILEATLIKRHKPRYNIVLRDDKNYPYLCLTLKDPWPAVRVSRKVLRDGSVCFGPYVPAASMWETLAFIRRTFPIRTCRHNLSRPMRPCVEYQMGRCLGPCSGKAPKEIYAQVVNEVKQFLKGERQELLENLRTRMKHASDRLDYEEAADLRDRLARIEKALESQKVISPGLGDIDVFGYVRDGSSACVKVFFVRSGMIIGTRDFIFRGLKEESDEEILTSAVTQFYTRQLIPPAEVLLPVRHSGADLLARMLTDRAGRSVRVRQMPRSGKRLDLLAMAEENARMALGQKGQGAAPPGAVELGRMLHMPAPPDRIDCFDISTLQGRATVGVRISWLCGQFDTDAYRKFRIRIPEGMDDFAAMEEVIQRCYRKEGLPDVVLIDGGRGQLEAARRAVSSCSSADTRMVAIAKMRGDRPERLYLPGQTRPTPLDPVSPLSLLLQKIRDEAHRFAITFHRQNRAKTSLASHLESVPGIGKARRLALLKAFGNTENIRKASLEDVLKVKGMNRRSAENLISYLRKTVETRPEMDSAQDEPFRDTGP